MAEPCIHQDWVKVRRWLRWRVVCLVCGSLHPDEKNWLQYGSYSPHSTYPRKRPELPW
jgi:hypothetical protein